MSIQDDVEIDIVDSGALHDANNHMKGTMFSVIPSDENAPIKRGVITIDGVKLHLAVFPSKISKSGRRYNPIRLQYLPGNMVLKATVLPVGKGEGR